MDAPTPLAWSTHRITSRGEHIMAIRSYDERASCVVLTVDASRLMTALLHGLANKPGVNWPNARQAVLTAFHADRSCHQAAACLAADVH